jgi:hypothetical protein
MLPGAITIASNFFLEFLPSEFRHCLVARCD